MGLWNKRSPSQAAVQRSVAVTNRCGFTLLEILLVILLMAAVLGGATVFLGNLGRSIQSQTTVVNSIETTIAPAHSQLTAALACQQALLEEIQSAGAIFVLGGDYEQGPATSTPLVTTLDSFVPTSISGAVPLGLQSPGQLRALFAPSTFAGSATTDFTIFFLTNSTTISAIIQVRTEASTTHRAYTVNYFRAGVLQDGNSGTARLSYRFALPLSEETLITLLPQARHYWLRQSPSWNIQEHLGVRIVLPDPMLTATEGATGGAAFPRFVHFLRTRSL